MPTMTLVAIPPSPTVDVLSGKTLDELAAIANAEDEFTVATLGSLQDAFNNTIHHAFKAGCALLAAKEAVEPGVWVEWQLTNLNFSLAAASSYMRLTTYRQDIEVWLADRNGQSSISAAIAHLRTLSLPPLSIGRPIDQAAREAGQAEARRLRKLGMSDRGIAASLGVATMTVACWLDPAKAAKLRKKREAETARERVKRRTARAAAIALAQKERDATVKKVGGGVAEAYSLLRRCEAKLDAVIAASSSSDERAALKAALSHAHKAEDQIVVALKIARVAP